jgi:hypothetical protein
MAALFAAMVVAAAVAVPIWPGRGGRVFWSLTNPKRQRGYLLLLL